MPAWLVLKQSKHLFLLILYDSINDMKYFRNCLCHTSSVPQPFCCWLLPIWPKLYFWAENGAGGLCQLGWKYNRENMQFSSPYVLVSFIWSTSETVSITPQPCHGHFYCWFLPIWPKLYFWAENGAYGLCRIGWCYNKKRLYFYWPYTIV